MLISEVQSRHPEIDNLSDRTWDEVSDTLLSLTDGDLSLSDAAAGVFKSISGQLRHEISKGLHRAMEKQSKQKN